MQKSLILMLFLSLSFIAKTQINPITPIETKAVIVMPDITKAQLENLTVELEKHKQITKAVYVYKDHNCLLVDLKAVNVNSEFQYFYDLVKVIGITCGGNENLVIKDEEAYQEIMDSGIDGEAVTIK
ncbi:MAG: hypothetical protein KA163_02685 [Bacteroidia bacterium]|nr:hypothetical protein [Bacteroidia bacterium]